MPTSWTDLIMSDGKKAFHAKPEKAPVDPAPKRRLKVADGIKGVLNALAKSEKPTRGWMKTSNDVAEVSIRYGTKTVALNGQDAVYIPAERAADFYKAVLADVEGGKLDEAIKAAVEGKKSSKAASEGSSRKGRTIAPWSPERRARHEAKKAAKAK